MSSVFSSADRDEQVLTNASSTGAAMPWKGGKGCFSVYSGTFGGATVKLQWSPDGGASWLDADRAGETFLTFTAAGAGVFDLPTCVVRGHISGGAPAALNAKVQAL